MSSQKGNTQRTRAQKYQNKTAFRNNLHDTSRKMKEINKLDIVNVCTQCKEVVDWKIKYKKYKPLSQPKTCIFCHLKSIKFAYHTICEACGKDRNVCCKCGQLKEIIRPQVQVKPKKEILSMFNREIKRLPERKRRAFYRFLDSFYSDNKNCSNSDEESEPHSAVKSKKIEITEDYLEVLKSKLEELYESIPDREDDDF